MTWNRIRNWLKALPGMLKCIAGYHAMSPIGELWIPGNTRWNSAQCGSFQHGKFCLRCGEVDLKHNAKV